MTGCPTPARRFTRAESDRLIELGVFRPDERIELIGGELVVAEPQGAAHDATAPFGWRYARLELVDAAAQVTPLAARSSVHIADLLP